MLSPMLLASLALLAAAPAPAPDPLKELLALDIRVARIGDRLARSGGCDAVLSSPGWIVQDIAQYAPKLRDAARGSLGLGDAPTIVALLPDSAAAKAGLRPGDEIVAVGGLELNPPVVRGKAYARLGSLEDAVETGLRTGKVTMRVRRHDTAWDVTLPAERGCASRFQLLTEAGINAEADGRYVQVSGALAEFAGADDELALVLAHELAHNILGHRARLKASKTSGGLFAGFGKNGARIRAAELEADDKALRLMASAGFDPGVAPSFWQRLGRKLLPGFLSDGTHPGTRERIARAEAEIARIRAGAP